MQVPLRLQLLLRTEVPTGVLLCTGYGGVVLMATPFLVPAIALHYGIGLGLTALISTGQLAGFVAGSWGAGKVLQPRRRVFTAAVLVLACANALSALLPVFGLLVALRIVAGTALGVTVWFGWVLVFGNEQRTAELAVVGPVVGIFAAPALAWSVDVAGPDGTYWMLGLAATVPLLFNRTTQMQARPPRPTTRVPPVPAALALLVALGLFTTGGAAVFVFSALLAAEQAGLGATAISVAFALNAAAGVVPARWGAPGLPPAVWLSVTGLCAFAVAAVPNGVVFVVAVTLWGFAFWAAIPPTFTLLARKSRYPEQRAGDAQAVMAIGRVIGPVMAGVILDLARPWVLGAVAGAVMVGAGSIVAKVARQD